MLPLNHPNMQMNAICTKYLRDGFFNHQHQLFAIWYSKFSQMGEGYEFNLQVESGWKSSRCTVARQMDIYTVSFGHLTCVWFRVKSCTVNRVNFGGRRERGDDSWNMNWCLQQRASGCECLWSRFSVFKEGPWINSESLNKDCVQ